MIAVSLGELASLLEAEPPRLLSSSKGGSELPPSLSSSQGELPPSLSSSKGELPPSLSSSKGELPRSLSSSKGELPRSLSLSKGGAGTAITALSVDSRTVAPGTLFVALPGEHVDGHDYVAAALAGGASAALVARYLPGAGPQLVVADPLEAMGRIARDQVDRARAGGLAVVALTGSQGKTSTKDLLGQVLERAAPTVAPAGNLNNEIGLPLTVARIEDSTRFLVAEMGARGVGHISYLTGIAPPDVGLVLNVGTAHVGEFGSREAIARAKGELVEALPAHGVAVLNADDALVAAMRSRTAAPVWWTSTSGDPGGAVAFWSSDVTVDELGRPRFLLHSRLDGDSSGAFVQLAVTGRHQVGNALAAAAAAVALGLSVEDTRAGLETAGPRSRSRMELRERGDGVLVINDAYNANPESVRAAIDTLTELARRRGGVARAVLGDMLELGEGAPAAHEEIGRYAAESGVEDLYAVGAFAEVLVGGARSAVVGITARSMEKKDIAGAVLASSRAGDVILVKASRGLALDNVAEEIMIMDSTPAAPARASGGAS